MTLKVKFDQEKHDDNNIIPLGNDEIKSILKTQSEAVFEDKNITNNSNFVKKSLIDIALDFELSKISSEKLDVNVSSSEKPLMGEKYIMHKDDIEGTLTNPLNCSVTN